MKIGIELSPLKIIQGDNKSFMIELRILLLFIYFRKILLSGCLTAVFLCLVIRFWRSHPLSPKERKMKFYFEWKETVNKRGVKTPMSGILSIQSASTSQEKNQGKQQNGVGTKGKCFLVHYHAQT